MRVIITGGTGLIGYRLAQIVMGAGDEVLILSRDGQKSAVPAGANAVRWDARTGDGWHSLISADTVIVNLAGQNPAHWRWTQAHRQRVLDSRLWAAEAVLDAIKRADAKPRALLQASAVGYYGDRGETYITEETPAGEGWRAEVCEQWEASVADAPIRTVYLRIGIVLSRNGGAFPSFLWAARLFGRRLGSGKQYIPWITNTDCARAIQFLLRQEVSGAVNICVPEAATNAELMGTLARLMRRRPLMPVPGSLLRLVMGEQATTVLDSQRVSPRVLIDTGFKWQQDKLESVLRGLLAH